MQPPIVLGNASSIFEEDTSPRFELLKIGDNVESRLRAMYCGSTFSYLQMLLNRRTPLRAILVWEDEYEKSKHEFPRIIRALDGVPSLFVLVVHSRSEKNSEAIECGFDHVIVRRQLPELPQLVKTHFRAFERNQWSAKFLLATMAVTLLVPLYVGFVAKLGEHAADRIVEGRSQKPAAENSQKLTPKKP